ncbi:peptidylprolyl isomerase [bacterium]|nr:peptidylprolyl isomerase [bacterium]
MKGSKLLITLAISAVLFTGCGIKDQSAIIKINDKAITKAQYDDLIDKSIASSPFGKMGDLKGNKDGFLYLMQEQQVINQLIIQELLDQEAEERGIKVTNKDVDEALKKVMDQMGGKEQLMTVLRDNGVSPAQFKKDLKNQVKMQKLADSAGKIEITDKDCEDFYKKNPDKFKYPEQVRAAHILIGGNPFLIQQEITQNDKKKFDEKELKAKVEAKMAENEKLAKNIAEDLKADNSKFAAYAKKYSTDEGTAKQGGDLGFFAKEQMVPEFSKAAFDAKPNTVVGPVKSQFGYHIIFVQDRKAAGTTPYEKAKVGIKDYLQTQKQIKALDDLTTSAKKKAKIEFMEERYNPEVIQKKLTKQVDDATGGQASKVREATKKNQKKK